MMLDYDFEYDGINLSDFGFIICSFERKSLEMVSEGSQITFNKTPVMMGKKHLLSNTKYDECIRSEFDICKLNCNRKQRDSYITYEEEKDLMRWLNRREFLKFRLMSERYSDIYFNASFNIQRYELAGNIIGFHLSLETDAPFGYSDITHKFETDGCIQKVIYDQSDEIGDIYLDITITCKESGNLSITNLFGNKSTIIKHCQSGEVITIKDMIIKSSINNHDESIMNDFNFIFPTISNSYRERKNIYTFSLPCSVIIKYNAIRKVGI